jgi:ribosomal protein S18 acetylase RimI-like enzyme
MREDRGVELAERGHAAMADRFRIGAEIDGGESMEEAGAAIWAFRSELPVLMNGAVRVDGGDAGAVLAAARAYFSERRRGFTILVREGVDADLEDAVRAAGMQLVLDHYPAMVRRAPFGEPRELAGDVELRTVADEQGARDYARVADASFASIGLPPGTLSEMPAAAFLRDDAAAFVAYDGGRPVAAASVHVMRGIGGIQWVAVVEEARGRGLADACTRAAADAGFELGADVAWLEASAMGEPVYLRMGFEQVFDYRMYLALPPG